MSNMLRLNLSHSIAIWRVPSRTFLGLIVIGGTASRFRCKPFLRPRSAMLHMLAISTLVYFEAFLRFTRRGESLMSAAVSLDGLTISQDIRLICYRDSIRCCRLNFLISSLYKVFPNTCLGPTARSQR